MAPLAKLIRGRGRATAVISAAAPAQRQGAVLGNNSALIVAGEVIGAAGGTLLAGIDATGPLYALAAVAALAAGLHLLRPVRARARSRGSPNGH